MASATAAAVQPRARDTGAPSTPSQRSRLFWTAAIGLLATAAAGAAELRGRSARTHFAPPPGFGPGRWGAVAHAGDAVQVLGAAGIHGRKLLLLTGRWARIRSMNLDVAESAASPGAPLDLLDADTAVLAAARSGIARELLVAMPPSAFRRRLDEVGGAKELAAGAGWFSLPFHGYPRRFSLPEALAPEREPVVALVEPSFLDEGAPADLQDWLRRHDIDVELGLVALSDPAASATQRERAAALAAALGASSVEVAP